VEEDTEAEVIGTLTLVYDHHAGELSSRLTELEHRFHHAVVSTLHVHFDERNCLEVLVVRGRGAEVRQISDSLIGTRGVHHGRLIIGSGWIGAADGAPTPQGGLLNQSNNVPSGQIRNVPVTGAALEGSGGRRTTDEPEERHRLVILGKCERDIRAWGWQPSRCSFPTGKPSGCGAVSGAWEAGLVHRGRGKRSTARLGSSAGSDLSRYRSATRGWAHVGDGEAQRRGP